LGLRACDFTGGGVKGDCLRTLDSGMEVLPFSVSLAAVRQVVLLRRGSGEAANTSPHG
jgi:hypothetical protein